MAKTKSPAARRVNSSKKKVAKASRKKAAPKKWSKRVNETSDAMDLEPAVFKRGARTIATSLKHSAERSQRRKATPYQSAMSMLTFYINRGGRNLSATDREKLNRAKRELRSLFGKEAAGS